MFRNASSRLPKTAGRTRRAAATTGLLAAGIVSLAACGSVASHSTSSAGGSASQAASLSASSNPTVKAAATGLGSVVVDAAGRTLYTYDPDNPGSGTSNCTGDCAAAWPPEIVSGQPSPSAAVKGTLGVIIRADGSRQLTLDGHPLYRYAGDAGAGATTGDGIGGIWHVVHVDGPAGPSAPQG
jgi:predicted lipoprotein with Yx(FWY)xxD motif